ncbi:MAG: DedA family protein [Hyphomicrobiaceae bacterium]|nr:DedA family protein [Hyphomicrobiaceae bacterium]
MGFEEWGKAIVEFVRANQVYAAPIVFVLAFGESIAFVSLILPFWVMLVGIGTLIGASGLDFWTIWIAASLGAAFGDWVSYWLGKTYRYQIAKVWPLSIYPRLIPLGRLMFRRYGWLAIVIARFTGPLRASVPLVAGICEMQWVMFQIANFASAFLWAGVLLAPGGYLAKFMPW